MEPTIIVIKDTNANPAPLGLFAFGSTTVLLNLHNAGIFEMNSMILAMGIFYGGIVQIIAGTMECKKNNTFGMTAFISFGSFWLTLAALMVMPKLGWIPSPSENGMVAYLILWGIFTACLFFCTLRISKALQFIFGTLTVLFFLLAFNETTGNRSLRIFTGYEGVVCGASAIYAATAILLNELYKKDILPLGVVIQTH